MGLDKRNGMTRLQLVRAWLKRLRDPKSKQAHGQLRLGKAYCCLGHGSVCMGRELPAHKSIHGVSDDDDTTLFNTSERLLNPDRRWLSITLNEEEHLIQLNDKYEKSLPEIADYIQYVLLPRLRVRWNRE